MCKVYTGYHGTSEIEHGLCACTVDNPLAKARGLSLRTGEQTYALSLRCTMYQCHGYRQRRQHPVIYTIGNVREIPSIGTNVKLISGTYMYILQTSRASFNQNQIKPTCLLCNDGDETTELFFLQCTALSSIREPILETIKQACASLPVDDYTRLLQIRLECSAYAKTTHKRNHHMLETVEFYSRRLCHALHCERYNS